MIKNNHSLLVLLLFNALSAIGGGIALMNGTIKHTEWIQHTSFTSLYAPGLILFAIVGGSALISAVTLIKNIIGWNLASVISGTIMVFWIVGEIVSIRAIDFLQVIYLVTGMGVIYLTPKSKA